MDHLNDLTEEQREVHDRLHSFLIEDDQQEILFSAAGGTGKSFVIRSLIKTLAAEGHTIPRMVTFAGRATLHLTSDLTSATTIHKLLYYPNIDSNGVLIGWNRKSRVDVQTECSGGLIVDESSMVPSEIHNDLLSIGVPIVWVGDDNQLEPVDPKAEESFCVFFKDLEKLTLTRNMRVMDGKENLLKLNQHLRDPDASMTRRFSGKGVKFWKRSDAMSPTFHEENQFDVIGCGTHKTRKKLNELVRKARGYHTEHAQEGEEVRCLKNTIIDGCIDVFNGERYRVLSHEKDENEIGVRHYTLQSIDFPDKEVTLKIPDCTWTDEKVPYKKGSDLNPFAFGYACTIHSLQGSTVPKFLFVRENVSFFLDQRRFDYTGVSRASDELHVTL